jgi:hypothetical protein
MSKTPPILKDFLYAVPCSQEVSPMELMALFKITAETAQPLGTSLPPRFYTLDMIIHSIIDTHAATGTWVSDRSGLIEYGPLANGKRTWLSVQQSMAAIWKQNNPSASCNGLTKHNCPYSSLTFLKLAYGLNDHFTVADIIDSLQKTHTRTREWAHASSGIIEYGSLANGRRTWTSVDASIKSVWSEGRPIDFSNGLTRENCPYPSLSALKHQKGLRHHYTVQDIKESIMETFSQTEECPTYKSGIIKYGPLANGHRTWLSIHTGIAALWRDHNPYTRFHGLTRDNCPYVSLMEICEHVILEYQPPSLHHVREAEPC